MHAPRPRGRPPHPDVLTTTEWRVLHLIRHGLRRRQIATLTGTSENAIKYHVANIASKLGVRGIVALREWPGLPADSLVRAGDGESADGRYLPGSPAPSPEDRRTASMTTAVALGALGQVS